MMILNWLKLIALFLKLIFYEIIKAVRSAHLWEKDMKTLSKYSKSIEEHHEKRRVKNDYI